MIPDGNPASLRTGAVTFWGAEEGKVADFCSLFPLLSSVRKMDSYDPKCVHKLAPVGLVDRKNARGRAFLCGIQSFLIPPRVSGASDGKVGFQEPDGASAPQDASGVRARGSRGAGWREAGARLSAERRCVRAQQQPRSLFGSSRATVKKEAAAM